MPVMTKHPAPWESLAYRTVTDVVYGNGRLEVNFADGGHASVPVDRLLSPDTPNPGWEDARHSEHEILVPRDDESDLEISWMDVRSQDDPEFAEFLVQTADEEARRVGARLRALRESKGLTSKEVAEAAGIAPMSLSRIELGRHDVVYRTLRKVLAAMGFGLQDLASPEQHPLELAALETRLVESGVTKRLVERLSNALDNQADRLGRASERIFGWSTDDLLTGAELRLDSGAFAQGHFKAAVNQDPALATYTLWAFWLALLVDQAITRAPVEMPENPYAIREDILERYGQLRFEELLTWCWEQGVVVLPLDDPGEFHGAVWTIQGRAVVVLKQSTPWESRWTFDLGHELAHLARHVDEMSPSVVESQEIDPVGSDDDDEQEASDFAGELLLGNPDQLARELAERTEHSLPRLKQEVIRLAGEKDVEADALANYMAWRLSKEGEDWWGAAAGLQDDSNRAFTLAREMLISRVDWTQLDNDDSALLKAALALEVEDD